MISYVSRFSDTDGCEYVGDFLFLNFQSVLFLDKIKELLAVEKEIIDQHNNNNQKTQSFPVIQF